MGEHLLLKGCKEVGSFLLRRKRSEHFDYVLSVYVGEKVMNYDITWDTSTDPGVFHLKGSTRGFSDLLGLVEHYKLSAVKPLSIILCINDLMI